MEDESWKNLKRFVGLKFTIAERRLLWPKVKHLFVSERRPGLSTWIKQIILKESKNETN